MRHIHGPLTLPKHPELLHAITDMNIRIAIHHDPSVEETEEIKKARDRHMPVKWHDIRELLTKCYNAINEQREDPRKY